MLAIVGLVLAGLPVAVTAPAQAGPHTVSINVNHKKVAKGAKVRISGAVVPVRARRLKLLMSYGGGWEVVNRTTASAGGKYAFTDRVRNRKTRFYQVCKIGGSAACSKAVRVKVNGSGGSRSKPSLAVTGVAAHELTTDDRYDIAGTASSDLIGKPVYLQLYSSDDSSWTSISSAAYVADDGTWQITTPARQAGRTISLRVFAPGTGTTRAASTSAGTFTVYGWYYLDTFSQVAGSAGEASRAINGVTYPRSIFKTGGGYVEYNLSRACKSLSATVGLDDTSNSAIRVSTWVAGDSTELKRFNNVGLGQANTLSLDVTGILRLRIEATQTAGRGYWWLAYGDAKVLCAY
jgi:hypothetical protein